MRRDNLISIGSIGRTIVLDIVVGFAILLAAQALGAWP